MIERISPDAIRRFLERIDKSGDCWIWRGFTGRWTSAGDRYQPIYVEGFRTSAHRLAWEIENGPIPRGLCVCHTCDNTRCVRVAHLFLGTHADNMADAKAKGRAHKLKPNARLTAEQVREIRGLRAEGMSLRAIGLCFGADKRHVSKIVNRKIWRQIP